MKFRILYLYSIQLLRRYLIFRLITYYYNLAPGGGGYGLGSGDDGIRRTNGGRGTRSGGRSRRRAPTATSTARTATLAQPRSVREERTAAATSAGSAWTRAWR